jgi:hypothetical protein
MDTPPAAFVSCGLVFEAAFEAARFALAPQPLALTVSGLLHGRTAGIATVRSGHPGRFSRGLVTTGPITKNLGMPSAA